MKAKLDEQHKIQDHALAQLLVHGPHGCEDNIQTTSAEVSIEELALLSEGKLDKRRREEVIGQLNDNQALYETWLSLQELLQSDAVVVDKHITEPVLISGQKALSLVDRISGWFSELFSWQGAFATSFGVALGAILMTQITLETNEPDSKLKQGIAIHAPLQAPQKASIEETEVLDKQQQMLDTEISHVEVLRIEGNTVYFELTLKTGEVISESYVYQSGNK